MGLSATHRWAGWFCLCPSSSGYKCALRDLWWKKFRLNGCSASQGRETTQQSEEETPMWLNTIGLLVTCAFSLITAPLAATAQSPAQVPRIGILSPAAEASTPLFEAFRQGL